MIYDYRKLKGRIKEVCDTQGEFAVGLGIGKVSLSKRLNNRSQFSQDEILKACDILHIDAKDISTYFFTPKV